jgi:hypothetical protein
LRQKNCAGACFFFQKSYEILWGNAAATRG